MTSTFDLKQLIHQIHDQKQYYLIELVLCNSSNPNFSNFDIRLSEQHFNQILNNVRSLSMWKQHFNTNNLYFYKDNLVMTVHSNGKEICFNNVCHKAFFYKTGSATTNGVLVRILKNNPFNSRLFPFTSDIDFMETVEEEIFQNSTSTFKFETHTYDDENAVKQTYRILKVYIKNTVNTDFYLKLLEPQYQTHVLSYAIEYE